MNFSCLIFWAQNVSISLDHNVLFLSVNNKYWELLEQFKNLEGFLARNVLIPCILLISQDQNVLIHVLWEY